MAFDMYSASYGMTGAPTGYQDMLKKSQQQYAGIMAGYQNALAGQQKRSQRIAQGYNQLQAGVLGQLQGAGNARSQQIADYYTAQAGQQNQSLINRGLGNTTVASSVGRGLAYDQTKAQTALSNDVAQNFAKYQSELGLAGLGYRGQANQQRTGLLNAQLGYQGDWQKALLGAGMQGASLANQFSMAGARGGGGANDVRGASAGGILDRRSSPGVMEPPEDPFVTIPGGGYGGYGGGSYAGLGGGAYGGNEWQYASPEEMANQQQGWTYAEA